MTSLGRFALLAGLVSRPGIDTAPIAGALMVAVAIWWPSLAPISAATRSAAGVGLSATAPHLANLDEKPLFNPSRRRPQAVLPTPQPAQVTAPPAPTFEQIYVLKGIARSNGEVIALVENLQTRSMATLRQGEELDDKLVIRIEGGVITFEDTEGAHLYLRLARP
jgi:hypothetical protein